MDDLLRRLSYEMDGTPMIVRFNGQEAIGYAYSSAAGTSLRNHQGEIDFENGFPPNFAIVTVPSNEISNYERLERIVETSPEEMKHFDEGVPVVLEYQHEGVKRVTIGFFEQTDSGLTTHLRNFRQKSRDGPRGYADVIIQDKDIEKCGSF